MTYQKIGLIGRVDSDETLYDGQTVKTREFLRKIKEDIPFDRLLITDTRDYKRNPIKVTFALIRLLLVCDDIFVLLSRNGRRAIFPLLYLASRIFNKRVYHCLIGGWLARDLENYPSWKKYLNSFEVNWVEAEQLVDLLKAAGVKNAEFLPNFKHITRIDPNEIPSTPNGSFPRKLCTFSRVVEGKGIREAINAVNLLNKNNEKYSLHIYGPIDPSFSSTFDKLLASSSNVEYSGVISPNDSVETLKDYDALLFPTLWYSEGIPGTIIDSLSAGVPVIASRWQYYDELLEDEKTGLSYDFSEPHRLAETIESFFEDGYDLISLRRECLHFARRYDPKLAFEKVASKVSSSRARASHVR